MQAQAKARRTPPAAKKSREDARAEAAASGRKVRLFSEYRDKPVEFAEEVLGLKLWSKQKEILLAIAREIATTVRSGHKIGKSTTGVAAALWFACTRERARVILSGPGARQVRDILWKELRRIAVPLAALLGAMPALLPGTGMQWPDGREIIGFTADDPEGMAGVSSPEMLYIVDEASGVDDAIFEAIDGNLAGGARIVLFSNPTKTTGLFYDSHTTKRDLWCAIHVSSADTPNCTGEGPRIPGLAEPAWVARKKKDWGEDSPAFAVRVLGNFPKLSTNAVIGLGLVEDARARCGTLVDDENPLEVGVDVARFGDDDSVITARRGFIVLEILAVNGYDSVAVAGLVLQVVRKHRNLNERVAVKVDSIGYGAGVCDQLRTFPEEEGIDVVDINVSEVSDDPEDFPNLRSQLWFATRLWLEEGGSLPDDGKLEGELLAPTYKIDAKGRRVVESKDDIKKRLKRSPDRADSLALAIYSATARLELFTGSSGNTAAHHRFESSDRGY